jgi:guanylate kinase
MENKISNLKAILVGHACSGKDWGREQLISVGWIPSISYTSRPPRPGEIDGITYHFTTDKKFKEYIDLGFFYEHNHFGKPVEEGGPGLWWYGTPRDSFDGGKDLFIMTPSGVAALTEQHRADSVVVYFDMAEEVRLARLRSRKDADKAERRVETDRDDFRGFSDYDVKISDPLYTGEDLQAAIADCWESRAAK